MPYHVRMKLFVKLNEALHRDHQHAASVTAPNKADDSMLEY